MHFFYCFQYLCCCRSLEIFFFIPPSLTRFDSYLFIFLSRPLSGQQQKTSTPSTRLLDASFTNIHVTVEDITQFLIDSYGDTTTAVVIHEDAEPNYLIGSSTGFEPASFF